MAYSGDGESWWNLCGALHCKDLGSEPCVSLRGMLCLRVGMQGTSSDTWSHSLCPLSHIAGFNDSWLCLLPWPCMTPRATAFIISHIYISNVIDCVIILSYLLLLFVAIHFWLLFLLNVIASIYNCWHMDRICLHILHFGSSWVRDPSSVALPDDTSLFPRH